MNDRFTSTNNCEQARYYIKHPSTVYNGIKTVKNMISTDDDFNLEIQHINENIMSEIYGLDGLQPAKFITRKQIMAVMHRCSACDACIFSLQTKKITYCSECGTKLKLEI